MFYVLLFQPLASFFSIHGPQNVFGHIVKCLNVIAFDDKLSNLVASACNIMPDIF